MRGGEEYEDGEHGLEREVDREDFFLMRLERVVGGVEGSGEYLELRELRAREGAEGDDAADEGLVELRAEEEAVEEDVVGCGHEEPREDSHCWRGRW